MPRIANGFDNGLEPAGRNGQLAPGDPPSQLAGSQMTTDWDEVSYVISSQYRVAVMKRLADGPATPSRISEDADLGIAHISRALQGLRDRGLVELLVSEERRKGRVYGMTERGKEVWGTIRAENLI